MAKAEAHDAVTWVLEDEILQDRAVALEAAIRRAGHRVLPWRDQWFNDGLWPALEGERAVFYGSLRTAARVRSELPWEPGAWMDVEGFTCSRWFPDVAPWLLHRDWQIWTVAELAASPDGCARFLGSPERIFVRSDSPLKPFSGRVLRVADVTLEALDYGVSFNDASLPVVVAAARAIGDEWRFVVAAGEVVTGSQYVGEGRIPKRVDKACRAWRYAADLAQRIRSPEPVYVLDVCEDGSELRLLELNPFSGAELHAADPDAVVEAVSRVLQGEGDQ